MIPRGESATAMFTTTGFPEGANIKFTVTASTDVQSSDDGSTLTVTSGTPGDVTVVATDGTEQLPRARLHLCQHLLNWFRMPLMIRLLFQ